MKIAFMNHPDLCFTYSNWKGETEDRRARPISQRYGTSEYHKEPQWLMRMFDLDKRDEREFAMNDMSNVREEK